MPTLARDPRVVKLAKDLGLVAHGDCLSTIRQFALATIADIVENAAIPVDTLATLRHVVAHRYRVRVEFLRTSEDIQAIASKYPDFHSALVPRLGQEFLNDTTEGITLEREFDDAHKPRYLAVADARGERAARAYFTAWHELTHLVLHPPQLVFPEFRRSKFDLSKDPLEAVVDHVTGHLAFYAPLYRPILDHAIREHGVTFRALDVARAPMDPRPSLLASATACLNLQAEPMLFVRAEMALKRDEDRAKQAGQESFDFAPGPTPKLRAVGVSRNSSADAAGLVIRPNMRVPTNSVLYRAFVSPTEDDLCADEDQDWWESSGMGALPQLAIRVHAARRGQFVYAFVIAKK
jgi:hypothetical protein